MLKIRIKTKDGGYINPINRTYNKKSNSNIEKPTARVSIYHGKSRITENEDKKQDNNNSNQTRVVNPESIYRKTSMPTDLLDKKDIERKSIPYESNTEDKNVEIKISENDNNMETESTVSQENTNVIITDDKVETQENYSQSVDDESNSEDEDSTEETTSIDNEICDRNIQDTTDEVEDNTKDELFDNDQKENSEDEAENPKSNEVEQSKVADNAQPEFSDDELTENFYAHQYEMDNVSQKDDSKPEPQQIERSEFNVTSSFTNPNSSSNKVIEEYLKKEREEQRFGNGRGFKHKYVKGGRKRGNIDRY